MRGSLRSKPSFLGLAAAVTARSCGWGSLALAPRACATRSAFLPAETPRSSGFLLQSQPSLAA